jgi:AcrR family transcriptional regulator
VTGTARRAQIVAATIEVIAEHGYAQTSFGRIAEHAGLSSTRLISYHFKGKSELIAAAAADVIDAIGRFMAARMELETDACGLLRTYIEGTCEFIAHHRGQMKALLEIVLGGGLGDLPDTDEPAIGHIERILLQGQETGEFREFDARVVATAVQRAVEGLPFLLESSPGLDCAAYGRELVTLFDLGTRRIA